MKKQFSNIDMLLWLVTALLIAGGVMANIHFAEQALSIRIAAWIVLALVALFIVSRTHQGQVAQQFFREARVELRKVVWPSRQQTLQTGLIVFVMIVITGLFLWGIDSLLMWAVSFLTGQRG